MPEPIRVYAGVLTAEDVETRAQRAVDDLERAGGFERARLLVATTTGRGWLDAGSITAFEYIAGGNSASVAMQYSYAPSGLSYLARIFHGHDHLSRRRGSDPAWA